MQAKMAFEAAELWERSFAAGVRASVNLLLVVFYLHTEGWRRRGDHVLVHDNYILWQGSPM